MLATKYGWTVIYLENAMELFNVTIVWIKVDHVSYLSAYKMAANKKGRFPVDIRRMHAAVVLYWFSNIWPYTANIWNLK